MQIIAHLDGNQGIQWAKTVFAHKQIFAKVIIESKFDTIDLTINLVNKKQKK